MNIHFAIDVTTAAFLISNQLWYFNLHKRADHVIMTKLDRHALQVEVFNIDCHQWQIDISKIKT